MLKRIKQYQGIVYCLLVSVLSVILLLGHLVFKAVGSYMASFPQLAPALAVLILAYIVGDRGITESINKQFKRKPKVTEVALVTVIPIICMGGNALFMSLTGKVYVPWNGDAKYYILCTLAVIIGCIGEEIGWRGFFLPYLEKRYTPFISSLILGSFWGVWHLSFTGGFLGFVIFIVNTLEVTIIMTWLYHKTNCNLGLMGLYHIIGNMSCRALLFGRFEVLNSVIGLLIPGLISVFILGMDGEVFGTYKALRK